MNFDFCKIPFNISEFLSININFSLNDSNLSSLNIFHVLDIPLGITTLPFKYIFSVMDGSKNEKVLPNGIFSFNKNNNCL